MELPSIDNPTSAPSNNLAKHIAHFVTMMIAMSKVPGGISIDDPLLQHQLQLLALQLDLCMLGAEIRGVQRVESPPRLSP